MTAIECTPAGDNEVFLRGRLAAAPVIRKLPSGDEFCAFRITVPRLPSESRESRVRVDSIDCAAVAARVRRSVERAAPGDQLEVTGSLHRRFWRSASGLGSRYEVLARSARVIKRPRIGA
ncbi:MAG TPA: single-stranded DNA-binding protein [Jatrophihabitantaceae bacterium]